ncbi:hypothetical protein Q5H92_12510 [Hymenobacter sp. M29]|uniref:Uncharacterized protein n=1 Tax=Hymenobacter mellowenesis TaxID=3063995 RepID=A0ABT9ABH3_9BACT|nr:hypothetical protein [Hymenobacter sp. M29]MDO7847186.1 hypothetical protein [Hymenobacter sp. M29]
MRFTSLAACAALAAGLAACNPAPKPPAARPGPLSPAQKQKQLAQLQLEYAGPEQTDSSAYVIYPLVLDKTTGDEDSYSSSSGRYEVKRYWNLAFYNPATRAVHLLDSTRRMAIYGYESAAGEKGAAVSGAVFARYVRGSFQRVDKLLYYSVRTLDYNRDGQLTQADPNYLFISDKAGRGFRQVSPDNYHVVGRQLLPATNQLLLQAQVDANHDLRFDDLDPTVQLVYDLATGGPARAVFPPSVQLGLKKAFQAQWPAPPTP